HQSDITPMSHDKVGNQIYKYKGIIKDIATRYRCNFTLTDKSYA
ncbi:12185_t:CDS:1, partial [Funneliformis mosseae]